VRILLYHEGLFLRIAHLSVYFRDISIFDEAVDTHGLVALVRHLTATFGLTENGGVKSSLLFEDNFCIDHGGLSPS
jgi:hypothetical protein